MALNQNQFSLQPILGMADLKPPSGMIGCQVDASQVVALVAGQAVKIVDSAGGVPKVVSVAADSDSVFGFIPFDIKDASFPAGARVDIMAGGDGVMYLYASAAIGRGVQVGSVQIASSVVGAVAASVASSGTQVIGTALDKAVNVGDLIRVRLNNHIKILA